MRLKSVIVLLIGCIVTITGGMMKNSAVMGVASFIVGWSLASILNVND